MKNDLRTVVGLFSETPIRFVRILKPIGILFALCLLSFNSLKGQITYHCTHEVLLFSNMEDDAHLDLDFVYYKQSNNRPLRYSKVTVKADDCYDGVCERSWPLGKSFSFDIEGIPVKLAGSGVLKRPDCHISFDQRDFYLGQFDDQSLTATGLEENIEWLTAGMVCESGARPSAIWNKLIISPYYSLETTLQSEERIICAENVAAIPFTVGNTEIFPPTIALQIKLKGEFDDKWSSPFSMSKDGIQNQYKLLIRKIPNQEKYFNREVEFRVPHPGGGGSVVDGSFFIISLDGIDVDAEPPVCYGNSGTITLSNLPPRSNSLKARISVTPFFEDPEGDYDPFFKKNLSKADGTKTNDFTIGSDEDSLEIQIDGKGKKVTGLNEEYYHIEVSVVEIDEIPNAGSLCPKTLKVMMFQPEPLRISLAYIPIFTGSSFHAFAPDGNGTVTISASGGRPGATYNYKLGPENSYSDFDSSTATTKTLNDVGNKTSVFLSNSDGCEEVLEIVEFVEPDPLVVTIVAGSTHAPTCASIDNSAPGLKSDGKITFTTVGGVGDNDYVLERKGDDESWEVVSGAEAQLVTGDASEAGSSLTLLFSGLDNGVYRVVVSDLSSVSDVAGNSDTSAEVDLIRSPISVGLTTDSCALNCYGGTTTIPFEGSANSYSYSLDGISYSNTNIIKKTLSAGSYEIELSKDGCSKTLNFEVNQPSTPLDISIQEADITPDVCEQSNGRVAFSIVGGKENDFPYYVTIEGSEEPIYRENQVISNGKAKTGLVFDELKAGQYTLKVLSGTSSGNYPNCEAVADITILPSNPLSDAVNILEVKDESCTSNEDAIIEISGITNINSSYNLYYGQSLGDRERVRVNGRNELTGLTEGNYKLWVEEHSAPNCVSEKPIEISVIDNPILITSAVESNQTTCETSSNGAITISHSGGVGPVSEFLYSKDNFATEQSESVLSGCSKGTYSVYVKDAAGCVAVYSNVEVTAMEIHPISWNFTTHQDASCSDASNGSITINEGVSHSSNQELTYYKNNVPYVGLPGAVDGFFESLRQGDYLVKIADEDGCYVEEEVSVGSLDYAPTLLFETITAVACDGKSTGQIEVNIEDNSLASPDYSIDLGWMSDGGFVKQESYLGDEPSTTFQNLTNKEYTIEVIDGNNCSNTFTYTPELHSPALTLTENWIDASCLNVDGAIEMSATGGISEGAYDFYFGSDTILGISDTIIFKPVGEVGQVKVVDDADCVVSGEENRAVRVRETAVEISEVATIHPSCIGDDDGRIEFLLRGDSELEYSYILTKRENPLEVYRGLINPGEVTIPDLPVGIYDLIVVEAPLNAYSTTEEISQWCSNPCPGIEVTDWKSVEVEDFSYNYIDYFGEATGSMEVTISGGSQVYDYEIVREVDNTVIESGEIREGYFTNNVSLLAGNYIFRFRDVNQCMYFVTGEWYEQPFTIEQPDEALFLPVQVLNNLSCFNSGNGRIEVAAQGGWGADYTYKLEGPVSGEWQSDGVFENLTKGTYSVLVRDSRAVEHQFTDAFTLTQPDPFSLNVARTKDATCPGYNNGEVDVVSTNGVYQGEGLKYQIYTESGEEVVVSYSGGEWKYNKLVQGSYTVEVTDANGCVADDAFAIGEPEQIEITSNQNYIRAKFDNTGEVSFEVSKGNGYYEYSWALEGAESPLESDTTEGALSFEDLPAGDYIFMLRDTARCRYEGDSEWMVRPIRMEEPEFELNFDVLIDSVTCNGLDDGKLSFNGIGGWGDYEFSFEGGDYSAQDSVEMLAPGVYNLAVRDAAGIIYERPIEVFEPEILSVSEGAQLSDVSCFGGSDGSISVDITGGNLAYFVSSDGENWFEGNVVKHLPIGQFDVFVKDAKGCETSTGSFTLNQPSEIVRDPGFSVKESTCQKDVGAIYADFSGGTGALSYTWLMERVQSDGSFETEILTEYATSSIEGLYAGHYMVDVMDEHGCIVQFPFDVNDNTDLSILSIDTYPVSCYGYSDGAAKAEISFGNPPYRYAWRGDGLATLGDSAWNYNAGEHRLSVWDEKGCYVSEAFEVGTPDSLFYQITEQIQPLCLGGAKGRISLAGTGGTAPYQYEWNDGTKTAVLEGVDPGDYQLVMTDSHACVSSFDFDFNYQRTVEPFIGNDTLICHYNTLKLDAGDYSIFEWHATTDFTSSNRFVEVNQSASYFLKVTDGDNCIGFDTLSLDVSVLEISDISTEDIRCAGLANGEATVTINSNSDNYTIEWPDGGSGTSSSGYAGGEYSVLVQNEYGCSDTLDYTLFEPDPLTITTSFNEPLCLGVPDGYVRPVVSGGIGNYRYQWNQGETKREISRLSEGNYVFTVTDDNDCWLTDEYYLAYKRTLLPDLGVDRVICHGNSVFLDPGSFNKLSWYYDDVFVNNDSILEAQLPGEYRVIVNDEDNCIGSDSIEIETSGSSLLPSFLMATSVPLGDTLLVVEVTQPKPKSIEWKFEGSQRVVESGEYFTKLIFDQEGIFPITLSSFSDDGCIGQQRKSILVTAPDLKDEYGESVSYHQNLISLVVSPNPSQGQFNAALKMQEAAPVTFYLVRIDTGQIYETRKRQGLSEYNESFTHSGVGQFVVFVESGGERLMEKIIVF